MSYQLIYTSAERGLKSGSRGFTTVAMTEGMPAHCLQLCETMSGYVHVFELNSDRYVQNPIAWSHYRVKCGAVWYSLVSRVSAHAKDYTGRTNKIAHHLMLEQPQETCSYANGPGDLLGSPFFTTQWSGEPKFLPMGQQPPGTREQVDPQAKHWMAAGLPTEGAASIAGALLQGTESPIVLLYDPADANQNALGLIQDILELLPPQKRWEIGFSSYYSMHPSGSEVHIRACAKGTDAARRAARHPRAVVVDLDEAEIKGLQHLQAVDQGFVNAAATGALPAWVRKAEPTVEIPNEPTATPTEEHVKPRPPPSSKRPGVRRPPSPPPIRERRPPLPAQKKNINQPILIGAGVGLILLMFLVGLKLIFRTPPARDEGMASETTTTTATEVTSNITEPPNEDDQSQPDDSTEGEVGTLDDGDVADVQQIAALKTDTEDVVPDPNQQHDDGTVAELNEQTAPDENDEENNIQDSESLTSIKSFKDISEIKDLLDYKNCILINNRGKRIKKKTISTRTSDSKAKDSRYDGAVLIYQKQKENFTVYYKKGEKVEFDAQLKNETAKVDRHLANILDELEDEAEAFFNDDSQCQEFEVKGGELIKFPDLKDRIEVIQNKIKDKKTRSFDEYIKTLKKIADSKPPKNNLDEFYKKQDEKIKDVFLDAFKMTDNPDDNPSALAFTGHNAKNASPTKNRYDLLKKLDDKEVDDKIIKYFREPNRRLKFEENIVKLFNQSVDKVGREIWIAAAIEAIDAGKKAKIEEVKNSTDQKIDNTITFKRKDNQDTLLIINLETTP